MSSKISALPAAATFADTDLLDSVVGGVNKKLTRAVLLTATSGENLNLITDNASVFVDGAGNVQITVLPGQTFALGNGAAVFFSANPSGIVTIECASAQAIELNHPIGSSISLNFDGTIAITTHAGAKAFVSYAPIASGNWAGAPTNIVDAIDRIAAVVSAGGASPIP
jgi:hypothetical protein